MFKKIIIGLVSLVIGLFLFIQFITMPTPNFMRNQEANGVKIQVQISDDERKPIIRTFTKEKFDTFSEGKIRDINADVSGGIEGDLPCIHLLENNKVYISFYKDGKKVDPENAQIKITAHASDYRDPTDKREIEGDLSKEADKTYTFTTKRYSIQYEKFFIEYLRIEVTYTIEGKDYISIFATNQDNATEGTDFFENEDLKEPLDPEE